MQPMATDVGPEIDVGPLSWVQGEIDQALTRGLDSLAKFVAAPEDATALKHAQTHIHQAAGAIQMVGLDAVVAFTDEIERQLVRLEEIDPADVPATCDAIDRAGRRLKVFLGELVNGAPLLALRLYPEYEAMQRARGLQAATPAELFFPDLSSRASLPTAVAATPAGKLASHLILQRRAFQRGLLLLLRGEDTGAKAMRDAVAGIEDVTIAPSMRSFWWTVGALLDAVAAKGLESGFGVKQLVARIDVQIRRVAEGSTKVSDRLRREVLYYVAISAPVVASVREIQRVFKLPALIPSADVLSADVLRLLPLLRQAHEEIGSAKDAWLKFASGRAENLPRLKQMMVSVQQHTADIGNAALIQLMASLAARLDEMPTVNMPEAVAMEYATGLLFAENAFENYANLTPEFPQQVATMLARLDAAEANKPVDAVAAAPLLEEMSKRAQERLLLAQVCREIQVNLRRMEQVLDSFFRDQGKRAELTTLAHESRQIRGALRMLGLDQADHLLELCQNQIETYANAEPPVAYDDLELLAESLSCLGFYVEAVEQQRAGRERLIAPLLAKRLGEPIAVLADDGAGSAEAAVRKLRETLPELVAEAHRAPADGATYDTLKTRLVALRDDAELIGDATLAVQADSALKELQTGATVALAATVTAITEGGAGAPAPTLSEETQRLLATDEKELDAEFLDIYLTEADEVLDSIGENRAVLEHNLGARDALRTVRRGFHTLKGSGRMVGLTDLGDLAYQVEKIQNRLLEDERSVTPAVVTMIAIAERSFRNWVADLRRDRRVHPDAEQLNAAIRDVEAQLAGGLESAVPQAAVPERRPAVPEEVPTVVRDVPTVVEDVPTSVDALSVVAESLPLTLEPEAASPMPMPIEPVELGSAAASAPAPEAVPEDETIEIAEAEEILAPEPKIFAAVADHLESLAKSPIAAAPHPTEQDEIMVGGVTLSSSLFKILVDEAKEHLATLAFELDAMQFDLSLPPSAAMVRASHTLCGIHRTGGFPLVADIANGLEQCLLGLQLQATPIPSVALPALAHAIAGLTDLVGRVSSGAAFTDYDQAEALQIQYSLEALRQQSAAATVPADAEAQAAREAARDEEALPSRAVSAFAAASAESEVSAVAEGSEAMMLESATPIAPVTPARPSQALPAISSEIVLTHPEADLGLGVRDDVDEQVLPIFLEEAAELFPQAGDELRAWRRRPIGREGAHQLRRTLHTFKGSARMAGAMRLGELTHRMESRLLDDGMLEQPTPQLFDSLDIDLDHIAFVLDALRLGKANISLPWLAWTAEAALPEMRAPEVPIASATAAGVAAGTHGPAPGRSSVIPLTPRAPAHVAPVTAALSDTAEAETGQRALLRVRADIIDRLVNEAGEVAITRARVDGELRSLKSNLLELTISVIRLRAQVREIEIQGETQIQSRLSLSGESAEGFDPLEFDRYTRFQELTRSLAEGVNDVATVQQSLLKNLDDADAALLTQARLSREMQQQLFSIRTVPFGSLSERLYRILRQTAKELDKRANLEIRGAQVELDRSVLEKLVGPLEHLLRNALDHGIEPRDVRVQAGKSETGEIALTVRQVGNEIVIELADDGAGLDLGQIRARASAQGRFAADAVPTDAQLIECIFHSGFSTADRVTPVSGRGIGMDVVRSEVAALGGRVEVATQWGGGTRFQLYLPLTLAVAQAVLVRAGGRLWALPAPMVEQVQQIKPEALRNLYEARVVEWQGKSYPFHYLPRLLGDARHNPETSRYNAVLLLRTGQNAAAVHVDEIIGNQEVVVKNIGPQLARVSGIAGATVLGTGEIVLIINPVQLAQRVGVPGFDPNAPDRLVATGYMPAAAKAPVTIAPLVMIVDDSLTVRKVTSRLLMREGFAVVTAKDGADALQLLDEHAPDVILLDIEMPRMDGFEFTKMIKSDPKHAHIPIIMITSRTAEKHRNRAKELGVDLYLGKPFQEAELLRNLREMLALIP